MLRVNQLDALQLDAELHLLLSSQLRRACQLLQPSLLSVLAPEVDLLLCLLLHHFTVARDLPSPGAKLQNLGLSSPPSPSASLTALLTSPTPLLSPSASPLTLLSTSDRFIPRPLSPRTKALHLLLTAILPYLHSRVSALLPPPHSHFPSDTPTPLHRLSSLLASLPPLLSLLSFVNQLAFLRSSLYPTLTHRLLSIQLLYLTSHITRQLSFDYMHQHMAMQVIGDVGATLSALIDWRGVGAAVRGMVRWVRGGREEDKEEGVGGAAMDAHLRGSGCAVCGRGVCVMATLALPCLHVFCYYCVASHVRGEAVWRCPTCRVVVTDVTPWAAALAPATTPPRLTVRPSPD